MSGLVDNETKENFAKTDTYMNQAAMLSSFAPMQVRYRWIFLAGIEPHCSSLMCLLHLQNIKSHFCGL